MVASQEWELPKWDMQNWRVSMSYSPTTWSTGDMITASAMNKIENGIANAGGALICTSSYEDGNLVLNKTVQEIYDATVGGTPVYVKYAYGTLGASGTGTFESFTYLAPVTHIYGYNYTQLIRICVSKPNSVGRINNHESMRSPAVAIFSATSLNDYPVFLDTIYVPSNYVLGDGSIT